MAQGKIIVETSRLDSTANQVSNLADQYEQEYGALYGTVTELRSAWDGKDNVAYTDQIEGFRDDFQRMTKLMRQYAEYLRKTAEAYRATQEEIASDVKKLSQGN